MCCFYLCPKTRNVIISASGGIFFGMCRLGIKMSARCMTDLRLCAEAYEEKEELYEKFMEKGSLSGIGCGYGRFPDVGVCVCGGSRR